MFADMKKTVIDFYTKEKEMDITLFKLLGTAGILVSIVGATMSVLTAADSLGMLINLLAAAASVVLLAYVHHTKKYVVGYLITSVCIFMGLFAWLFMEMGGLNGSMPYLFVFGIIFSSLMYKGVLMYIMGFIQTAFYIAVCIFTYNHPEYAREFETPWNQFSNQLAGIFLSSVGISLIFIFYIRQYRKQQRIAEESSKAKSMLLANISHEIRTPINMLLGMNEMILRESENTKINEYARNVANAGQHLLFMVNQFLDLSRIDMGKEELFEDDFSLSKLVQSLGAFWGKEAEKKSIEFVMDIDRSMPESFRGDMRKLSQILSNLLSNAVKYTEKGTIVFTVQNMGTPKSLETPGKGPVKYQIHFEISDTGSGISEDDQKKIFESFERAEIIRNRGIEGTGLGLAISNKLAHLMGTEIKVKSEYGAGSVFWFDISLAAGEGQEETTDPDSFFIAPEAKILAVDDNDMNLMVVKSLLKRTMVRVDVADSAPKAYEKYEAGDYDLVLMDYMMPDIDGIEAMEHLRRVDEGKNRHVPIIVLTADATLSSREKFMASGFDDYLLKPIDSGLLESTLIKHLPKGLITKVESRAETGISEEAMEKLKGLLKKYDISLDMALKHLSGDISQYSRVCEYFVKDSGKDKERLKNYIASENYDEAAILVHALKGNAGNVGGEDLYYSSIRLEHRIKERDIEFVVSLLPHFIMQWNRVEQGLTEFLKEFGRIKPDTVQTKGEEKPADEDELWSALLEAVHRGRQTPALKLVEDLCGLKGRNRNLESIGERIRNMEFDKAESIIEAEMTGKDGEKDE